MAGASYAFIRFQKPLHGQCESLLRLPDAVQKTYGDTAYVQLVIPVIGPGKSCVCAIDDHTLLVAMDEANLRKRLDEVAATVKPPAWRETWDAIDGGLVTVVANDKELASRLG